MRTKVFQPTYFKALPDEGGKKGRFEAVVSTFDTLDLQGERVRRGAFDASLKRWRKSGDPLPLLFNHLWSDPNAHVGWIDPSDAMEVEANQKGRHPAGLWVRGTFDVDKPYAKQVYDLAKQRRLKEWSIGYDVFPGGEHVGEDKSNELTALDLIEISITLKGANTETVSLGVKSDSQKPAATKAGDRYVRWGEDGWHSRHIEWMAMQAGATARKSCSCTELSLCREHKRKLDASRRRKVAGTTRTTKCPSCGERQSVEVRPPVKNGVVPWGITNCCGALLGWSPKTMSRDDHVREMKIVRQHVGPASDWVATQRYKAQLEEILADWTPESRKYERVGGHDEIRKINEELARLDPGTKRYRKDLGDKKLEERVRKDYPQEKIMQSIPDIDARMRELTDPPPAIVGDGETFTLDVGGVVVDSTETQVEGEGTTYRVAVDSYDPLEGEELHVGVEE